MVSLKLQPTHHCGRQQRVVRAVRPGAWGVHATARMFACAHPGRHRALRAAPRPAPRPTNQVMGKSKVLVKVHPEGKYVVDLDKSIDIGKLTPGEQQLGGWGLGV